MNTRNFGAVMSMGILVGTGQVSESSTTIDVQAQSPFHRLERHEDIPKFVLARTRAALRKDKDTKKKAAEITRAIIAESERHNFDPLLIMSVIAQESHFRPHARGGQGELGLMQLKPETARWVSKISGLRWQGSQSLLDPVTNIRIGTSYLALLRREFEPYGQDFITAYNVGPGRVRSLAKPPGKSSRYSRGVLRNYEAFYAMLTAKSS